MIAISSLPSQGAALLAAPFAPPPLPGALPPLDCLTRSAAPQPRAEIYEPHLVMLCMAGDIVDLHERGIEPSLSALADLGWPPEIVDLYVCACRNLALCTLSDRLARRRRDAARILGRAEPASIAPLMPAPEATPSAAALGMLAGALTAAIVLFALEMMLS